MRKLGIVALVAVGLSALVTASGLMVSMMSVFLIGDASRSARIAAMSVALGGVLAVVLIGLSLIVFRHSIATRLFDEDEVSIAVDVEGLMRVAIVFIGLDAAIFAVPRMVSTAVQIISLREMTAEGGSWLSVVNVGQGVALPAAQLLIGIAVVAMSGWLAHILVGTRPQPVEAAAAGVPSVGASTCPNCGAPYDPSDYRPGAARRCASCHELIDAASGD